MPDSLLQKIIEIEVKRMIAEAEAISEIDHPYLKGKIREIGFGKLLSKLLPPPFKLGSGKIHDHSGKASGEIDLVIYDPSYLPPLMFGSETGVFPLESTRYAIEIKSASTTTSDSLRKFYRDVTRIQELEFLNNYSKNGPKFTHPIPLYFGYGASNKVEVMDIIRECDPGYMQQPRVPAICIAGIGYWFFSNFSGYPEWVHTHATIDHYEVVALIGGILNTLIGPGRPLYGYYLLKPERETLHTSYRE